MNKDTWYLAQTNRALTSYAAVDQACDALQRASLPLHPDRSKNWDNYLAIEHTLATTDYGARVLDAGAGDESVYLPGLRKLGYTDLLGCNLDRHDDYTAGLKDGIPYCYADITDTPFSDNEFGFVACLSVIEHGVDVNKFLTEMTRVIKPGGCLFVSFDYWQRKLDTAGLVTHDAPINIFSEDEVIALLDFAATVGLSLEWRPWIGACVDSIISWAGKNYTFGNLLLRKNL